MSSWNRKREYDYIGLLIGLFLLVVATFIMWIAKLTRSIFLGVVATIIFIIGFYAIMRKKSRAEFNRAR